MNQLQCPFTWRSRVVPPMEFEQRMDKLALAPTPWSAVVVRIGLAYTAHRNGQAKQAQRLMVQCYSTLLPINTFHTGCGIIERYRVPLKHVLDSTWAYMRLPTCDDKSNTQEYLNQFVAKIDKYDEMSPQDQAAIMAIRANLAKSPKNVHWIRQAVRQSPEEGQWHCVLGKLLLTARIPKTANYASRPPDPEELKALGEAYRLRRDPEAATLLAESWLDNGSTGFSMAGIIIKEALRTYPDSASVHARSARVLWLMPPPHMDLLQVEHCYRRALALAPECLFLRFKLGGLCVILDKLLEAREHYRQAATLYPEAQDVLGSLLRLPGLDGAGAPSTGPSGGIPMLCTRSGPVPINFRNLGPRRGYANAIPEEPEAEGAASCLACCEPEPGAAGGSGLCPCDCEEAPQAQASGQAQAGRKKPASKSAKKREAAKKRKARMAAAREPPPPPPPPAAAPAPAAKFGDFQGLSGAPQTSHEQEDSEDQDARMERLEQSIAALKLVAQRAVDAAEQARPDSRLTSSIRALRRAASEREAAGGVDVDVANILESLKAASERNQRARENAGLRGSRMFEAPRVAPGPGFARRGGQIRIDRAMRQQVQELARARADEIAEEMERQEEQERAVVQAAQSAHAAQSAQSAQSGRKGRKRKL